MTAAKSRRRPAPPVSNGILKPLAGLAVYLQDQAGIHARKASIARLVGGMPTESDRMAGTLAAWAYVVIAARKRLLAINRRKGGAS